MRLGAQRCVTPRRARVAPFARAQAVTDALETVSRFLEGDGVSRQPVLITGPAACGKSTLANQWALRLATAFLARQSDLVPLEIGPSILLLRALIPRRTRSTCSSVAQ